MEVTRRELLQRVGTITATAAAASLAAPATAHEGEPSHEEGHEGASTRLRRWAMVVDLRRCDGCAGLGVPPQCTQYCIWSRVVPEGQEWVEVYEDAGSGGPGDVGRFMPAFCMQCENAPCTNVCPVGATFHTPGGVVLIDQERCIGCRLCMAACPYDRRFFNWEDPVQPDFVKDAPYEVRTQVPAMQGTVMKCDFCLDRASIGGLPYCIEGCPRGALYYGDLEEDIATNGDEMIVLSHFIEENNAFRYKEELGTEPRVWYVPGHGEEAERKTSHEDDFLKAKLEWPWRRIADRMQEMSASRSGG